MPKINIVTRKNVKSKRECSISVLLIFSYFLALIIFFAGLSVFSLVVMKNVLSDSVLQTFVIFSASISVFIPSVIVSINAKTRKFIVVIISAILIVISEFLLLASFNNYSLSWQAYLMIPVALISAFSGSLIGVNRKR